MGYTLHASLVGLHTLAFFKSIHRLGTVPTAVSKGAIQAGNFLFAHIFFCHADQTECWWDNNGDTGAWRHWQKPVAFLMCASGCMFYVLGKEKPSQQHEGRASYHVHAEPNSGLEHDNLL